MKNTHKKEHHDAGKNSFGLIDTAKFFKEFDLKKGSTFLDAGCGRGEYAIAASKIIGDGGLIYAIDKWEEGIADLQEQIYGKGIKNIKTMVGDISKQIPIDRDSVDVCLLAVVLHGIAQSKDAAEGTFKEITKVLKPQGMLAIIEFKKDDSPPPGPPNNIRLSPEEIENMIAPFGFRKERVVEVGPHNYLITFSSLEVA